MTYVKFVVMIIGFYFIYRAKSSYLKRGGQVGEVYLKNEKITLNLGYTCLAIACLLAAFNI